MFFSNYRCSNIGPSELQARIKSGSDFLLLDVRTPQEHAAEAIKDSYLLPLAELAHRVPELPMDKEIVIYCRIGNRSAYACEFLAKRGFNVKNLEGGIVQWNKAGSASMPKA